MSEFKVGDRARVIYVDDYDIARGITKGDIIVIQEEGSSNPFCELSSGRVVCLGIKQLEPIPPQPSVSHNSLAGSAVTFDGKTYILRDPATRPTIKIAGVIYELENV